MHGSGRHGQRQRIYSFTALLVATMVALVLLQYGRSFTLAKYKKTVYRYPHRTLLRIAEVQVRFKRNDLDGNGREDYASSLDALAKADLITDELAHGVLEGYRYRIERADERTYKATAEPAEVTSQAIFYSVDQMQMIRAQRGRPTDDQSVVFYDPLSGFTGALGVSETVGATEGDRR
ncbi:MAG: hypothetical protein AB7N76_35625 [Planctomycetota bacterium]